VVEIRYLPSDESLAAGQAVMRHNHEVLSSIWDDALRTHIGEWILVYDDGQVLFGADPVELLQQVSAEQRRSAVLDRVQPQPDIVILSTT
jgi:hypothetical protein